MTAIDTYSLSHIPLLSDMAPQTVAQIEQMCSWKSYESQEQIIDRQSDSDDIYFVVSGSVRVVIYSLSGREIILDELSEGNYFGELAALDEQPRSASVMALGRTLIAAMPRDSFLDILKTYPDVALKVMRNLCQVIRVATDRIMDLSTLGANNRIHAELLRQAKLTVTFDNQAEIRPIPVHGELASRVSTTRETVARVMNDLARRGLVERLKDALVIKDIKRLQEMVEDVRGD